MIVQIGFVKKIFIFLNNFGPYSLHTVIGNMEKAKLLKKIIDFKNDNRIWNYKTNNGQLLLI